MRLYPLVPRFWTLAYKPYFLGRDTQDTIDRLGSAPQVAAVNCRIPRHVVPSSMITRSVTETLLVLLARFFSGASVRWIDCQPDTVQRVYFANHTSHLDAIIVWSSLPRHVRALTRPVAAKDYWDKGWVRRRLAKVFGALLIDRKEIKVHQSPVDLMIREIGQTHSLIVFPEGGRSPTGEIQEFKSGLYYLSKKRPDLELVPVHIDNLNRVLPPGRSFCRCRCCPASASGRRSGGKKANQKPTF